MAAIPDIHTPKSILITGGAGFIASHVTLHLAKKYPHYNLVVLDKLDYCAARGHLTELEGTPNFKFVHGNILSADLVGYLLRAENIDTVMHFAASTHVDNSFNSSISFTENNVMGTHVLLECVRVYGGVKRFLHCSTDEVYGGETESQGEDSLLTPTNPYACSKAAAEFVCHGYTRSFGVPIVITRGNNVYGPHQFPDKLIPKSICLLAEGRPCFIHGDGTHARNFLFAEDAARAFDVVVHKGKIGEIYNVGSPDEFTNLQVIEGLLKSFNLFDQKDKFIEYVRDRAFNDTRYSINSNKLTELGWAPQVSWADGLKLTTEWYTKQHNLARWPGYRNGLTAHPSLDNHVGDFSNAAALPAAK